MESLVHSALYLQSGQSINQSNQNVDAHDNHWSIKHLPLLAADDRPRQFVDDDQGHIERQRGDNQKDRRQQSSPFPTPKNVD